MKLFFSVVRQTRQLAFKKCEAVLHSLLNPSRWPVFAHTLKMRLPLLTLSCQSYYLHGLQSSDTNRLLRSQLWQSRYKQCGTAPSAVSTTNERSKQQQNSSRQRPNNTVWTSVSIRHKRRNNCQCGTPQINSKTTSVYCQMLAKKQVHPRACACKPTRTLPFHTGQD